jgi:hypothetical protein
MTPEFVPTYYACLGRNQVNAEAKRETIFPTIGHPDCKAAFINRLLIHFFPYDNVYSIMGGSSYGVKNTGLFSYDPLNVTGLGATMTYVLLQIAFYMGFETVLVVGLDHSYPKGSKKHFYDDKEYPDFEAAPGPVYGGNNEMWQSYATAMFTVAQEVYKEHGRRIINLTDVSKCEVFSREAISSWVKAS